MTAAPKRGRSPPDLAVEILVEAGGWPPARSLRALAERAVAAAIARARPPIVAGSELAIVFTDDGHIRALNRRFRGKDKATNVLSFPAAAVSRGTFGPLLGDIVLGHETVKREAENDDLTLTDHLMHLIVHGFLHLVSYEHEVEADALAMESLETAILGDLGVADPYGDR